MTALRRIGAIALAGAVALVGCGDGDTRTLGSAIDPADRDRPSAKMIDLAADNAGERGTVFAEDCSAFATRLEDVQAAIPENWPDIIRDLDIRAEELLAVVDAAPEPIRDDVRTIASTLRRMAAGFEAVNPKIISNVSDLAASDDEGDRLTAVGAMWGLEDEKAVFAIGGHCDVFDATEMLPPDDFAALFEPGAELDAFARHGLAGMWCVFGHCGSQTGGVGGLMGEGAESGMDDDAQQCWESPVAYGPGDDAGCDALYQACAEGDLFACNDLSLNSLPDTDYSRFGATCGGRADTPDLEYDTRCQLLE
jgi:hypothetical protein